LLDGAGAATRDQHFVTLIGETGCGRTADARAATGYDDDFFVLHVRSICCAVRSGQSESVNQRFGFDGSVVEGW